MTKLEKARALRNDPTTHYNCAQAVLIPFAEECGMSEETACKLCAHFGGGMRMGATCGALTGAFMVLGALGMDDSARKELLDRFKARNTHTDCKDLLRKAINEGVERKAHCDGMIDDCINIIEEIRAKH